MVKIHGGDIYNNRIQHDFSVNLNPLGCPQKVLDAISGVTLRVGEYPDIEQKRVREEIAALEGLVPENVICGNGASELLMTIVRMTKPKCGLVLAPSFYGYEYALSANDCEIKRHQLGEDEAFSLNEDVLQELTEDVDIIFLCNPNNPTGRCIDSELIERVVKRCDELGIWLVLDECFIDMADNAVSFAERVRDFKKLIVVKAFTKLLAIPGIRFGYALSTEENIELIRKSLPEWNLSVFAEEAAISGCKVLREDDFLQDTLNAIKNEKSYLVSELEKAGIELFPSDASFLLIKTDKDIYDGLLQRGILIRDCSNFHGLTDGFYRIAVKNHDENAILIENINEVI